MSDRLNELQRQRALLQEHLAWLEREIGAERSRPGVTPSPAPPEMPGSPIQPATVQWTTPPRPATPNPAAAQGGEGDFEEILEKYRAESKNLRQEVRHGCFMYFALAIVLLVVAAAALYFTTIRRH